MATRKFSSKPELVPLNAPAGRSNPQSLRDQSTLIGYDPTETMTICARVLKLLAEFHLRKSVNELEDDIESGEYYVITAIEDALEKQAAAMEASRRAPEVANG